MQLIHPCDANKNPYKDTSFREKNKREQENKLDDKMIRYAQHSHLFICSQQK